jgi:hypothetical protein
MTTKEGLSVENVVRDNVIFKNSPYISGGSPLDPHRRKSFTG